MKTISTYLWLLVFALVILSCEKEKVIDQNNTRNFEFDNLAIGDVMLYSYFTGYEYPPVSNNEVKYTGDTLELKVIDKIDGKSVIQEQITSGSAIFDSEDKYIWGEIDLATELLWEIREDSIIITSVDLESYKKSQLLFGKYTYSLSEIMENEIEFDGWKTTRPTITNSGSKFFIKDGELHGITYPHLNAIIFGPSPVDADGTTHIFNKEIGFVRTTSISPLTTIVRGWDRIN